ncbi:SEC-C domain-containing protein [Nocardioides sp. Y6]|uniref:SEC-C domain-containing protein n=1 Tax=Nocardioides malaquae TaxID=2773426 RepID=A0ABR9RT66_9ACTN|nr:DUF5926 family protein [Nocardioides malaquae]MBE7324575.1 SEC-C domain-containing protein [Nocardioides malaquae]
MAKKSRKNRDVAPPAEGEVGPRQPCPCGSGKRYKACHGAAGGATSPFVARPFEGLAGECDLIALRELVPAATAPLTLADGVTGAGTRVVKLCTLLPAAAPAMVRDSGEVWLGLQVQHHYGDPSRDLAAVLLTALEQAERGESGIVGLTSDPGAGPRLQDVLATPELDVTVHDGFEYWVADVDQAGDDFTAALQQANETIHPTERLTGVEAAYWTNVGTKEHLRWVMPHDEDALLTALARLHAAGKDVLVEDSRFVGMFRAHGLLAPVWDLPVGTGAAALEEPASRFAAELETALAQSADLTPEERSARAGLANRQVTIR